MATGVGEDFTITAIDSKGVVTLDSPVSYSHDATFVPPAEGQQHPALMSAEVVNLSRNIVFTGDDFKHVPCDPTLPESVPNEQTSTEGCRCASFRTQCTIGLHTAAMHGGTAKIQNTRVERCGQRGVYGRVPLVGTCFQVSHSFVDLFTKQVSRANIASTSTNSMTAPPACSRTTHLRAATSGELSYMGRIRPLSRATYCMMYEVLAYTSKMETKCE